MQDNEEPDDFDDMDFEDLDAEDDFDESWDDFDDVDDAEVVADDLPADPAAVEEKPAAGKNAAAASGDKKKGFVQKNFNVIVIGIAVLGGGAVVLSQLAAPPANAPGAEQALDEMAQMAEQELAKAPTEIPELSGDMPPMPSPMDSNPEPAMDESSGELADLGIESEGEADDASSDVLTPIPELSDDAASEELADLGDLGDLGLEIDPEPVAEETAEPTTENDPLALPELDELPTLSEQSELDSIALEEDADAVLNVGPDLEEADLSMDDGLEITPEPVLEEPLVEEQEIDALAELQEPAPVLEEDAIVEPAPAPADAAPATPEIDTNALELELDDLNDTVAEQDNALEQAEAEQSALSAQLEEATSKISELESKVAKLQAALDEAKATPAEAEPKEEPVAKEEISVATIKPAPVPKTEPKPAAKPAPTKSVNWVLRAAQPGVATISPEDGSDLRRVEVGDRVSGLGKIQSIAVENGKWVVQGSEGRVTQ